MLWPTFQPWEFWTSNSNLSNVQVGAQSAKDCYLIANYLLHTALNGELSLTQSGNEFQQEYHTDKRRTKIEIC